MREHATGDRHENVENPPGRCGFSLTWIAAVKKRGGWEMRVAIALFAVMGLVACDGTPPEAKTVPMAALVQVGQRVDGLPIYQGGKVEMLTETEALELRQPRQSQPGTSAAIVGEILYVMGCNTQPWSYDGETVCRSQHSYQGQCVAIRAGNNGGVIDFTDITYPDGSTLNDRCISWESNSMWGSMLTEFLEHVYFSNPNPGTRHVLAPNTVFGESWNTRTTASAIVSVPVCPVARCGD